MKIRKSLHVYKADTILRKKSETKKDIEVCIYLNHVIPWALPADSHGFHEGL
jgi:hypothetical protein